MEKVYDICAKTGSYELNGQTKNRYTNVGSILKDNSGRPFMVLSAWFNPAGIEREKGRESIILSLFPPKSSQSQSQSRNDGNFASFDDVPF